MAILYKPNPYGELGKLLGDLGGDIQRHRDTGTLSKAFRPYFEDEKTARAAARNPGAARALMKMKAEEAKSKRKEELEKDETKQAIDLLQSAEQFISLQAETEKNKYFFQKSPFYKRYLQQAEKNRESLKALYTSLNNNKTIKDLNITLAQSKDDPLVQMGYVKKALEDLGVNKKEESKEAPAEEKATEETREATIPSKEKKEPIINESERENAENELDVKDVVAKIDPTMQDAPVDDAEDDEYIDQAAINMAQSNRQPMAPGMEQEQEQQAGLAGNRPQEIGNLSPTAPQAAPIGKRYAPGEAGPRSTSFEGFGGEVVNTGKAAAAGLAGAPRALGETLGSIQQLPENLPLIGDPLKAFREGTGLDIGKAAQYLPSRKAIFNALGGKEAAPGSLESSILELAGDIPEQIALTAALAGAGKVKGMVQAVKGMFKHIVGSQAAGQTAKFLTEQVVGPGQFADGVKPIVSLAYALGVGPTMEKVAKDVYKEALYELPDNVRPRNLANLQREGTKIHNLIKEGGSGFQGTDANIFAPFVAKNGIKTSLTPATYKRGFEALEQLEKSPNLTPMLERAKEGFKKYLKEDFYTNPHAPQDSVKLYKQGDEMWSQLKNATTINKIFKDSSKLTNLLGRGKLAALVKLGFYGGAVTQEFLYNLAYRPNLRRFYKEALQSAMNIDGRGVAEALVKMNKAAQNRLVVKEEKPLPLPTYKRNVRRSSVSG